MSEQTVNKVKYYIVNKYFDSLNKRFDPKERPLMLVKQYLIMFLYLLLTIKFFVMLFFDFDYSDRLILFDPSVFIGGIEKYNNFIFLCGTIFGAYLHHMLYLTTSKKSLVWIQLIYTAVGSVCPFEFGLDLRDRSIKNKLISRSKLIIEISNLLLLTAGKNFISLNIILIIEIKNNSKL